MNARISDLRVFSLIIAMTVYAFWGSPTPDQMSWAEIFIGVCLVIAVGLSGVQNIFKISGNETFWHGAGRFVFLFGTSIVFVNGVLSGHKVSFIIRDFVPFLFMILPVFMADILKGERAVFLSHFILYACLVIGIVFSVRVIAGSHTLYYLGNSPLVLFTAIYSCGRGLQVFIERFSLRCLVPVFLWFFIGLICLYPLIETQQRASLAGFVVVICALYARLLWFFPQRAWIVMIFVSLFVGVAFGPYILDLLLTLQRKSDLVGFNQRFEEWQAVWDTLDAHFLNIIFGAGWGARFESPAVADIRVLYTHGLLGSMLLKAGLAGLSLIVLYFYGFTKSLMRYVCVDFLFCMALAVPFAIDILLYASFKSLDFGLLLLMISLLPAFFRGQIDGNAQASLKAPHA